MAGETNMAPRYFRQHWSPKTQPTVKNGDYVLATKYSDGDPGDHFCIGFYDKEDDHAGGMRHLVVDGKGQNFRANGFRRVARIGNKRGKWMVQHLDLIEAMKDRFSVWHWYRAPWSELNALISKDRP